MNGYLKILLAAVAMFFVLRSGFALILIPVKLLAIGGLGYYMVSQVKKLAAGKQSITDQDPDVIDVCPDCGEPLRRYVPHVCKM